MSPGRRPKGRLVRPSSRKIPPNTSSTTPKNARILPNSAIAKIVLPMPPSYNDSFYSSFRYSLFLGHWLIFVWCKVFLVQDARSHPVAQAANPSYFDDD